MATKGQIAAGATLAIIGGLAARKAFAKKKKKKKAANNCAPYVWDPGPVSASINALLDEGADDGNEIAIAVATEHFGPYPGGGVATFPPAGTPPAGVQCVWERTVNLVNVIIDQRGFKVQPYEIVEEWTSDTPTPGYLFRITPGEPGSVSGLVRQALANAGIPDQKNNNGVYANRVAMAKLVECSPWNDALYNYPGSGFKYGPNGRGLNLNATHADNLQRMMLGEPPRRAITGKAAHDGTGGHLPFVWIPRIQPNAPVPILQDHEDGSSGINPPSDILAFGLENVPPAIYGCEQYEDAAQDLPL